MTITKWNLFETDTFKSDHDQRQYFFPRKYFHEKNLDLPTPEL